MKFHGVNAHGQGVKDKPALVNWHKVNMPSWALVMDELPLARDIKTASPNTQVIVRVYRPDGFWYTQTPEAYLSFMDSQSIDNNLWLYVENEAGLNVDWNVRLLEANAKRPTPRKLVILNLSVGTPADQQIAIPALWLEAGRLLRLVDQYRDFVVLGLHEYQDVVPVSGFKGGYPDNAGAQPNLTSSPGSTGNNYIPSANWPQLLEAQGMSKFHCGRFMFLNQACAQMGIKIPRIVLTEHGQDDVSDIKAWVEHSVGAGIRGFKTLQDYWKKTYPDWSLGQTYYQMLKYLRNNVYFQSNVEGALLYCYGHVDSQWEKFDVEGNEVVDLITNDPASPIKAPVEAPMPVEIKPVTPPPLPPVLPEVKPIVPQPITPPPEPVPPPGVHVTPGGTWYVEPKRNWRFTLTCESLTQSEAEMLMRLYSGHVAHIEQMEIA